MIEDILLVAAGLFVSLTTGAFFAFQTSVNGALHRVDDESFIRVWQHINRIILNPAFLLAFMGPLFILPIVTFMNRDEGTAFILLIGASVAYIFGLLGITFSKNVPLNEQLDRFKLDGASASDIAAARKAFEGPWYRLHNIRTFMGVVSTALLYAAYLAL